MRAHPRPRCIVILALAALAMPMGCDDGSAGEDTQASSGTVEAPPAPRGNPLAGGTSSGMGGMGSAASAAGSAGEGRLVVTSGVSVEVPESWRREATSSSMRAAQFSVPPAEGVESGEGLLVVFHGIGGSADDNIERWIGQMTEKTGAPVREAFDGKDGLRVSTVRMVGTYSVGSMMGGSGSPEPDTMFLGAVIEGGSGMPVFLRLTGPRQTLEPLMEDWASTLASIDRAGSGAP